MGEGEGAENKANMACRARMPILPTVRWEGERRVLVGEQAHTAYKLQETYLPASGFCMLFNNTNAFGVECAD